MDGMGRGGRPRAPDLHLHEDRAACGQPGSGLSGVGRRGRRGRRELAGVTAMPLSCSGWQTHGDTHARDPRVVHGRLGRLISCKIHLKTVPEVAQVQLGLFAEEESTAPSAQRPLQIGATLPAQSEVRPRHKARDPSPTGRNNTDYPPPSSAKQALFFSPSLSLFLPRAWRGSGWGGPPLRGPRRGQRGCNWSG